MLNNIRGILNRRNDPSKSPDGLASRTPSEDNTETNATSAEGFLCPTCFQAFPTAEALQNHYESIHFEAEVTGDARGMYNCPACKMKLGSEIELNSHFTRHHASNKEGFEIESMALQVKALEEGKALLQEELRAVRSELSSENSKIRGERDSFKLKSTKLTDNLADLKLQFDELKAKKNSLEASFQSSEERRRKLEAEIQKRPEADDVNVLQKELVSVQTLMNDLTLRREAEKETLQKQCDSIQETCLKLQAEKTDLENVVKSMPRKEEISSLQEKISEMSMTMSHMQKELNQKEIEKSKLQINLEKCANYQEIKAQVTEKNSAIEDLQRQSSEKDDLISKLKTELETSKKNMEEMKKGREKLFSKIEEGEGANAAMLQLKEENARLQEQFLQQQTIYGESANETETKVQELRESLKKSNSTLKIANEEYSELEKNLETSKEQFQKLLSEKEMMSEQLNSQIHSLKATEAADKSKIKELTVELNSKKNVIDQTTLLIESLKEEIKKKKVSKFYVPGPTTTQYLGKKQNKTSYEKKAEKLEMEKQTYEKKLFELGKTLPVIQADLLKKEKLLNETEMRLRDSSEKLLVAEKAKTDKETELNRVQKLYEEMKSKLDSTLKTLDDFETTKIEFCDKISALNEEKLQAQMKESDLKAIIETLQLELSEVNDRCSSYEEENKSLRSSITGFQNEKNSMLSEMDGYKKEIDELNEVQALTAKKMLELTEECQSARTTVDKTIKESAVEKDVFLKDKVKLQKQMENLENDCAKQLSQIQETVKSLESQLEEAEEKNVTLKLSVTEMAKLLEQKDTDCEKKEAHHIAQAGVLTENIKTLREDLTSEQKRRETLEQKLDEVCGLKLELDAKLENALDERKGLLGRCLKSETECERLQKITTDMRRKYDDCVAALQELGRENQTLQMENMKLTNRKWTDDATVTHCSQCGKLFNLTNRKHHCRNCGSIFCNECSAKTAPVATYKNPVRVCDNCYNEVAK